MAGVALTIGLGGGVSIGTLVVAHRTDRAYPAYVTDANVGEVSVNPSISSTAMDQRIRTLRGVVSVQSSSLLLASLATLTGGPYGDLMANDSDSSLQVRGSTDGEFIDADRPAISEGRLPSGKHEVFIGQDARDAVDAAVGHAVHLGDTISMAFWWGGLSAQDAAPAPDQVVQPIGVEQLHVVGFGHLSDEVLPDELYSRDRLIVSSDVAARYGCAFDIRSDATGDDATFAGMVPADCATQFIYYSLHLGGAGGDLTSVRAAYSSLADELDTQLPASVEQFHSYEYLAQTRADLGERVRHTTRPAVAALTVFGLVAGLATLAIATLLFTRNMRRDERDQLSLLALGATTPQRAAVGAATPLAGAAVGLVGATLVAALISPIGPLGVVRDVDPSPGIALPTQVVVPALGVGALALVLTIASVALVGARRASSTREGATSSLWRARLLERGAHPSISTGMRATLGSTGSWSNGAVLIGCVIAIAAVMSASIFGTNLSALVTQPERYGWPWDLGVLTNYGYGFTDTAAVEQSLDADAPGATHSFYGFDPSILIDGHPMPAITGLTPSDQPDFPVVDGRAAHNPGEAVIGVSTAQRFGIGIGDHVDVQSPFWEPQSVDIVGTAVLPSLGAFTADRTGLGTGIFIIPASAPSSFNPTPASFTGVSLPAGEDVDEFVRTLGPSLASWDVGSGVPPVTLTRPVRPPEVVNVSDMRTAPLVLGGVLAVSLMVGLALSTAVSVRERRRELAILRTLGFSRRSLYISVWWQVA
ncbi:MAG: hypothetical protein JWN99_24, partial [Ilumatobacteraceae bacterium]|nr:hypothetical protein [Ilumatobacteraceae bacterium]